MRCSALNPWSHSLTVKTGVTASVVLAVALGAIALGVVAYARANGGRLSFLSNKIDFALMGAGSPIAIVAGAWFATKVKGTDYGGYYDRVYARPDRWPGGAEEKLRASLQHAIKEGQELYGHTSNNVLFVDRWNEVESDDTLPQGIAAAEAPNLRCRPSMEDVHFAQQFTLAGEEVTLTAVCDGHGDDKAMGKFVRDNLRGLLETKVTALDSTTITNALVEAMIDLQGRCWGSGGTTITGALTFADEIYIFNVGDSRTILIKPNGPTYQLTEDAKPNNRRFRRHIEENGHQVSRPRTTYRVNGNLSVARDIGSGCLSPRPKITRVIRSEGTDDIDTGLVYAPPGSYIVHACDGVWDVMSTARVGRYVTNAPSTSVKEMTRHIAGAALEGRTTDNVTVMMVTL